MDANRTMREVFGAACRQRFVPGDAVWFDAAVGKGWAPNAGGPLVLEWCNLTRAAATDASTFGEEEYHHNDIYVDLHDLRQAGASCRDVQIAGVARALVCASFLLATAPDVGAQVRASVGMYCLCDADAEIQGARVRVWTERGSFPHWFDDLEGFRREHLAVLDRSDLSLTATWPVGAEGVYVGSLFSA